MSFLIIILINFLNRTLMKLNKSSRKDVMVDFALYIAHICDTGYRIPDTGYNGIWYLASGISSGA